MATITITKNGLHDMAVAFEQAHSALGDAVQRGLTTALVKVANYAVANKLTGQVLNQRTGRLISSVQSSVRVSGSGTRVTGRIGSVFYGRVHEFGATIEVNSPVNLGGDIGWRYLKTVTLPPRPWLGPSLDENKDQIAADIKGAIREAFKGTG